MTRLATIGIVLAAAASAVLLNVLLLGSASSGSDPVGKLTPTASLPASTVTLPAQPATVQPRTGPVTGEGRDD